MGMVTRARGERVGRVSGVGVLDVTKFHYLGVVDYAQHNFARLRPLLRSKTGRVWDGVVDGADFPDEGLVYSVDRELHYSAGYWTFRVTANTHAGKDALSAIQARPAIELLATMEALDSEASRKLVMEEGLASGPGNRKGSLGVPELDDRWIITPELTRQPDDRWRPAPGAVLKALKVLVGEPEVLCGPAVPSGQYFLPPIVGYSGELRDWTPPELFLEGLADDLRRWTPVGQYRARAAAAAQALRDLAPHIGAIPALSAPAAKAALARAVDLTAAAEVVTGATTDIIALIVAQEPFREEMERRRVEISAELEAEALRAVDQVEGAARAQLLEDQRRIEREIVIEDQRLAALRDQVAALGAESEALLSRRAADLQALDQEIDGLLARAATEPAKLLAEWMGTAGFVVAGAQSGETVSSAPAAPAIDAVRDTAATLEPEPASAPSAMEIPLAPVIAPEALGGTLFLANPASNPGEPWLPLIEAALRARELPVLMGAMAREFGEVLLEVIGGHAPPVVLPDPTVLSLVELTPNGSRGAKAPLAPAFERAARAEGRVVVTLLDDLDPAAAGFWLPELARCLRRPGQYGFPDNLLVLAIVEADPGQMGLSLARAGELFPLVLDNGQRSDPAGRPAQPFELPLGLIGRPAIGTRWPDRRSAFQAALASTFKPDRVADLSERFGAFLKFAKGEGDRPMDADHLDGWLARGADRIIRPSMEA